MEIWTTVESRIQGKAVPFRFPETQEVSRNASARPKKVHYVALRHLNYQHHGPGGNCSHQVPHNMEVVKGLYNTIKTKTNQGNPWRKGTAKSGSKYDCSPRQIKHLKTLKRCSTAQQVLGTADRPAVHLQRRQTPRTKRGARSYQSKKGTFLPSRGLWTTRRQIGSKREGSASKRLHFQKLSNPSYFSEMEAHWDVMQQQPSRESRQICQRTAPKTSAWHGRKYQMRRQFHEENRSNEHYRDLGLSIC